MSDLLAEFEHDCAQAGVAPHQVLKRAGIHTSLWWKWREGKASPTLKNFERARAELHRIKGEAKAAA